MKFLLLLASSFFTAHAFSIPDIDMEEWKAYKMEYKKSYSEEEDKFRMKVFLDNKREIEEHNARYKKGEVTFTLGLNQFSDMLHSEFLETYSIHNATSSMEWIETVNKTLWSTFIPNANAKIPDEVNWVENGAVTPVENQRKCRAGWAFSVTGALEGQHYLKRGKLINLSEQNLVDCSWPNNCRIGIKELAFFYIAVNNGINTDETYPYVGKKQKKCHYDPYKVGATCKGFKCILPAFESLLQQAVATIGPVSVVIDADKKTFKQYKGGVYSDSNCSKLFVNHAVLVVGYGTDKETNQKYWLVKNSWGTRWGEKGYIRIARDAGNMCGIASFASYPLL